MDAERLTSNHRRRHWSVRPTQPNYADPALADEWDPNPLHVTRVSHGAVRNEGMQLVQRWPSLGVALMYTPVETREPTLCWRAAAPSRIEYAE